MSGSRQHHGWVTTVNMSVASSRGTMVDSNRFTRRCIPKEWCLPWLNGFIRPQVFTEGFLY